MYIFVATKPLKFYHSVFQSLNKINSHFMKKLFLSILTLTLFTLTSKADEGMWLPSQISAKIQEMQAKGLELSAADLYSLEQISLKDGIVQFGRGCTGELISPDGLLITNHHCGFGQIQYHSSVEHDYLTNGFWAMNRNEELPNPGLTVRFLVRMEDVTEQVLSGYTDNMDEFQRLELIAKNSETIIENAKQEGISYAADILPLFYGNVYYMFVYQVFPDVRLVGAPPSSIGKFGGDTDNWMWPRHTGDFSIFRIYADKDNNPAPYSEENVPYHPKHFFKISLDGVQEEEFTFVYGFPGSTREYILSAEVDYIANVSNPAKIDLRTQRLNIQNKYMENSPAVRIQYASKNAGIANAWKKWQGEAKGIKRLGTVADKKELENNFKVWAADKPQYNGLVEKIDSVILSYRNELFASEYFNESALAVELVRFAGNYLKAKPENRAEMAESFYKDFYLPIDKEIFVAVISSFVKNVEGGYYPQYFSEMMAQYNSDITAMAEDLFTKSAFTQKSKLENTPEEQLAEDVMVKFYDAFSTIYKELSKKVAASTKELNLLYRTYMRGLMEFQTERLFYPDANLTLRIAYGQVKGYHPADGVYYTPSSSLEGIMEKDNPEIYDYNIPQRLRDIYAAKDYGRWEYNGSVPVAFIATNHTTGGNSGSPVINSEGNLIGVNFDRVWEGTMSDIVFDPTVCRNIALDIRYALFVIDKVAGASHLIDEMVLVGGNEQ